MQLLDLNYRYEFMITIAVDGYKLDVDIATNYIPQSGKVLEAWLIDNVTEGLPIEYPEWCLDIMISDHVSHHFDFGLCER